MKFRMVTIITAFLLAIHVALYFLASPVPWWHFLLIIMIYVTVVFIGCVNLSLGFFMPIVCRAQTNEPVVALSFDDGPAACTENILNTLKQHNASASFFCIGKNIAGNEQIIRRIDDEGHLIGNHSYSHHFWFDLFGTRKMLEDMKRTDSEIVKTIVKTPLLFRPPYGVINPALAAAIKKGGYVPVGWSIRSFDTRIKDRQKLLTRILKQLKPGGIILLHDSMEITAAILPELITHIKSKGFNIVRLDKMLNIAPYA